MFNNIHNQRTHITGLIWKLILINSILLVYGQQQHSYPYRCSNRLEIALEHMLRRNQLKSGSRTSLDLSPYSVYHSIYNNNNSNNKETGNDNEPLLGDNSNEFNIDDDINDRRSIYNQQHRNTKLNEKLDSFYDNRNHNNNNDERNYHDQHNSHYTPVNRVEVADLKVRLPNKARWVHVDKCQFSATNRTLDTRLIFPDLTISGKVILHPTGGKCNMILRLRRAGIEFRTIPLQTSTDESRRSGTASVRTDSHFAEPGFLSVFAHGCQGPSGIKFRQNSKRRLFNEPKTNQNEQSRYLKDDDDADVDDDGHRRQYNNHNPYRRNYQYSNNYYIGDRKFKANRRSDSYNRNNEMTRSRSLLDDRDDIATTDQTLDPMNFNDDILNLDDDNLQHNTNIRTFNDLFGSGLLFNINNNNDHEQIPHHKRYHQNRYPNKWHNINENFNPIGTNGGGNVEQQPPSAIDSEEISDALSRELEQLFSMGVRGMLTTYMQKALQPAIKETLMENMGYTLSYG